MRNAYLVLLIVAVASISIGIGNIIATTFPDAKDIKDLGNGVVELPYANFYVNQSDVTKIAIVPTILGDCTFSKTNCVVMVNRANDAASEFILGKNGQEMTTMAERYNGTFAIIQRHNPNVYAYMIQFNTWPVGQEIHYYPQYVISKEGYFGKIVPYDNGTVKFVKGDPNFPSCTKC